MKNYYKILGIESGATSEEIRKAYKKKAFENHPDRNPGFQDEANERMKKINEAFEVLSDEIRRDEYDRSESTRQKSNNSGDHETRKSKSENSTYHNHKINTESIWDKIITSCKQHPVIFIIIVSLIINLFNSEEQTAIDNSYQGTSNYSTAKDYNPSISQQKNSLEGINQYPSYAPSNNYIKPSRYNVPITNNVKLRQSAGTNGELISVIVTGEKVHIYQSINLGNEIWYRVFDTSSGKMGWINEVGIEKKVEEIHVLESPKNPLPSENPTISDKTQEVKYFDCGEGGTYFDSMKKCVCSPGYGATSNGKCTSINCGEGGTYFDSMKKCSCSPGYGISDDQKCVPIDCGAGGTYFDSMKKCSCSPGYGKLPNGKCSA